MTVHRVYQVDPDPDCPTCLGTALDEMEGPHTGLPYVVECECSMRYDPPLPTADQSLGGARDE